MDGLTSASVKERGTGCKVALCSPEDPLECGSTCADLNFAILTTDTARAKLRTTVGWSTENLIHC